MISGPEDYYARLGVARDAPASAIKRAFRVKARAAHPDAGGSAEAFEALKEAFDTLSDPDARARYDATLGQAGPGRARMQALMAFALDSVLAKLGQKTEGLASEELMALMAARLRERRAELAHEKALVARALEAAQDICGRADIAPGFMRAAVEDRRDRCEARLAALQHEIETIDACVAELRGGAAPDSAPAVHPDFGEWVDIYATVG